MPPKLDRPILKGKGCEEEFGIPADLVPGSVERKKYIDLCKAEWDALNSWAIAANIVAMKKYGGWKGDSDGEE
jgi:hypothetical protein